MIIVKFLPKELSFDRIFLRKMLAENFAKKATREKESYMNKRGGVGNFDAKFRWAKKKGKFFSKNFFLRSSDEQKKEKFFTKNFYVRSFDEQKTENF